MANTIVVKEKLFVDVDETKVDEIRSLVTSFIDSDVKEALSSIIDNYATVETPQTVKLIVRSEDFNEKLELTKDELEYIECDCIDDAIADSFMSEYSDSFYIETETETERGYTCEECRDWVKVCYGRFASATFDVEFDTAKGELVVTAECNAAFTYTISGSDNGPDEISRDEYIDGVKALVTDKETADAIEKAMNIDGYGEEELEESEKLTKREKELLDSIGFFDDDCHNCTDDECDDGCWWDGYPSEEAFWECNGI